MGVPKFYRWISERYPCLSEIVKEYQIPEYDNLYLDMNGIIHNCSHPNDDDPHFRISEEQIYKDVFHYIEILFRLIQPQKIFFMAIDGVAPRAKMNQQRGRRFRSANEAEENEKKAKEKGEVLPSEARFDSNCITPGTDFMAKLDAQLQYFITAKVSNDKLWRKCKIIYSGHQTPGEGEHKIMEYIRYSKSQPNYNPNTRHCLYGLDADLTMLGLTSHEPHFSLLREEVRFGGKKEKSKRTPTPEETTFHLLHLSLMREYIEYEFYDLHESLIEFSFDLEAIIDDWIMMGFLVGNDFIPNLPGLHINKDGLPILYDIYKKVLPTLDGYINEGGTLNLKRFEKFMETLTEFDIEQFHEHTDNMKYIRSKKGEVDDRMENREKFEFDDGMDDNQFGSLEDCPLNNEEVMSTLARLGIEQDPAFTSDDDCSDNGESQFMSEFRQHKRHYYMTKMGFKEVTSEVLRDQATSYVLGIQWILNYYYNGICSWEWYYPHHYAPYISDIKHFVDFNISFEKGKPFLPYEQLLAVLPPLSVKLLPTVFATLMLSENSPLSEFYPQKFETDLNGKQQEWEAVVLIPFINEKRLLEEMKPCNENLTDEEHCRNSHGPMCIYTFTPDILEIYKAPNYFPSISINHAHVELIWREKWDMHSADIVKGLLPEVRLDVYFAGFPTLKHLRHTFRKEKESVKVFQHSSRGDNFILEIEKVDQPSLEKLAERILGMEIFVSWPHLVEAKVVSISSIDQQYYITDFGQTGSPVLEYLDKSQKESFSLQASDLKARFHNRWGIDIGETSLLITAKQMSGRNYVAAHDGKITLEKHWSDIKQPYPFQSIVCDIRIHDPCYKQYMTVHDYFLKDSKVFMLGNPHYGAIGEVIDIDPEHRGRIRISAHVPQEPQLSDILMQWQKSSEWYMTGFQCASRVGITPHLFARITGTVFLAPPLILKPFQERETARNKLNIGLNLKNNKKSEEVIGFTRKCSETKQWLYSHECIYALKEYQELFPEIFEFLNRNTSQNDIFQDEVFPDNYQEKYVELSKWLKNSSFASAERCRWGSVFLDPNIVDKISDGVEKVSKLRSKLVKMQVKPHLLFKPNPLQGSTPPDPTVTFELFDRVINIREGYSVPLGSRGTVIGIQPADKEADKLYDILFDEAFPGGMTLSGPNSKHRCYRLHWAAIMNISHGSGRIPMTKHNGAQFKKQYNKKHKDHVNKVSNKQLISATDTKKVFDPFHSQLDNQLLKAEKIQPMESLSKDTEPPTPNPSQLPTPFSFKSMLKASPHKNIEQSNNSVQLADVPNNCLASSTLAIPGAHDNETKKLSREITSDTDIPFVMHGNFFSNWPHILDYGLRKDDRNFIPCVTYIPPKVGLRSYQIHIYLDVKKLLQDGFKLLLLSERQVLCPTGSNGYLSTYYFEKVVDTENNCLIFPSRNHHPKPYDIKPPQAIASYSHPGEGRGKVLNDRTYNAQPLQAYENIWNQVQELKSHQEISDEVNYNNMQTSMKAKQQECRKEVSLSDLFGTVSLAATTPPKLIRTSSPNNSPFVPTQVVRKQTPRKKTDLNDSLPMIEIDQSSPRMPQTSLQNVAQKGSVSSYSRKTKKKSLSRIAAKFPTSN